MKLFQSAVLCALFVGMMAGCNRSQEAEAPGSAAIDTTNDNALDGLSTRQVEREAQSVSDEQAAREGLVDTTIHLENLSSSDSTPPGATTQNPVRPGTPAETRGDTAAPLPETRPGVAPRP